MQYKCKICRFLIFLEKCNFSTYAGTSVIEANKKIITLIYLFLDALENDTKYLTNHKIAI